MDELTPGYRQRHLELYRKLTCLIGEVVVKGSAAFLGAIALIADRLCGAVQLLGAACDQMRPVPAVARDACVVYVDCHRPLGRLRSPGTPESGGLRCPQARIASSDGGCCAVSGAAVHGSTMPAYFHLLVSIARIIIVSPALTRPVVHA
jgi:hypothetical protein